VAPPDEPLEALATALVREAERDPSRECCGLVTAGPSGRLRLQPVANVAATPASAFELCPTDLLAALRRLDSDGARLVAVYHAHLFGGPELSTRDLEAALLDGRPLLAGVEQVVIALRGGRAVEIRAHAWDGAVFAGRTVWRNLLEMGPL
jgi:proteasome lid subunit RPN8/RPN11